MLIGRIEGATRSLGAPPGWTKGQCSSLWIRDEVIEGIPFIVSAWLPQVDEVERLQLGAAVHLYVAGGTMPPVALAVGLAPT